LEVFRASGDELRGQGLLAVILFMQAVIKAVHCLGDVFVIIHPWRVCGGLHDSQSALKTKIKEGKRVKLVEGEEKKELLFGEDLTLNRKWWSY
jgi:hypothetical protein